MKKFMRMFSVILCVCLLFVLITGCGGNNPSSNISSQPPVSGNNPEKPGSSFEVVGVDEIIHYGPKAETPSFTATTQNSADVKAYGAKADGTTNDAAAFTQAMNAVANKGYLYLAAGRYFIGSDITVPENIVLVFNRGAYLVVGNGVKVTVNGFIEAGRYRIFSGEGSVVGSIRNASYPHWFGDLSEADDTAVMQAAVNASRHLLLPASTTLELGTVHLTHPITIEGTGAYETSIKHLTTSDVLFSIESDQVALMRIKATAGKGKGATTVLFDNSQKALSQITVYRVNASGVGKLIDTASSANAVTKVEFVKVLGEATKETGIHLVNFKNDIILDDVIVSNLYTYGRVDSPLFLFENCEGMDMINIDAAGGGNKGEGADGFYFRNCKNIKVGRAMVDFANGFGLVLEACSAFELNYWINSLCQEGCLYIKDSENITFNVANNNGNGKTPGVKNYDANTVIDNSKNIVIKSMFIQNHCYDGLAIRNSTGIQISDLIINGMAGRGYVEEGTSNNNTIVGLTIVDASKTPFTQVGANSQTYSLIINNVTKEALVKGAATR